jgi:hypothetical protein
MPDGNSFLLIFYVKLFAIGRMKCKKKSFFDVSGKIIVGLRMAQKGALAAKKQLMQGRPRF